MEQQPKVLLLHIHQRVDGRYAVHAMCDDGSNERIDEPTKVLGEATEQLEAWAEGYSFKTFVGGNGRLCATQRGGY